MCVCVFVCWFVRLWCVFGCFARVFGACMCVCVFGWVRVCEFCVCAYVVVRFSVSGCVVARLRLNLRKHTQDLGFTRKFGGGVFSHVFRPHFFAPREAVHYTQPGLSTTCHIIAWFVHDAPKLCQDYVQMVPK